MIGFHQLANIQSQLLAVRIMMLFVCVFSMIVYMTTHQQLSPTPQQSQDSPHLIGLGLTMEVMEDAVEPGMVTVLSLI